MRDPEKTVRLIKPTNKTNRIFLEEKKRVAQDESAANVIVKLVSRKASGEKLTADELLSDSSAEVDAVKIK